MVVKVHSGSAHVRGTARNYPYFIASLFDVREKKDGGKIYYNTGLSTYPRRSFELACQDGEKLAKEYEAEFREGYGSLHNVKVIH